jgi:methylglutamate dehydrogenase subunit D
VAEALQIIQRDTIALAIVMARKGVAADSLGAKLGLTPPTGPSVVRKDDVAVVGTGPGVWLAVAENGRADWADWLGETLAGLASVSDQSGGYAVFRVSGSGASALLQKGAAIDLDPVVFCVGAAATTVIGHVGVILWKVDDGPTFDVALFRSFADSFRDWTLANADGAPAFNPPLR